MTWVMKIFLMISYDYLLTGRICNSGVISPAVIDGDGRPVRVEHVMQLADMADANNNDEVDSDSDVDA